MTNEEFIESIRLKGEEWKEIPKMEGFYMASSFGRIVSLGRYVKSKNGSLRYKRPKLQELTKNNNGYLEVRISINAKRKTKSVHRLIAMTFIQNPNNHPTIDHIDRNRTNNHVTNLRWCTLSENMKNPLTIKHISVLSSKIKHQSQYTKVVRISMIDNTIKHYQSLSSTKDDGFTPHSVYLACSGRIKTHKGHKWMYLSDYEKLVNQNVKELFPN